MTSDCYYYVTEPFVEHCRQVKHVLNRSNDLSMSASGNIPLDVALGVRNSSLSHYAVTSAHTTARALGHMSLDLSECRPCHRALRF